jgi:hypothetical protein
MNVHAVLITTGTLYLNLRHKGLNKRAASKRASTYGPRQNGPTKKTSAYGPRQKGLVTYGSEPRGPRDKIAW